MVKKLVSMSKNRYNRSDDKGGGVVVNILIINCGSSSLKYQLIQGETEKVLAKGVCERIGIEGGLISHQPGTEQKLVIEQRMNDHTEAVKFMLGQLMNPEYGVIRSLAEIDAVGHRIVHGGERFTDAVLIDDEVIKAVEKCSDLAPLHNPANLIGIEACKKLMPNVPMVGVFDTAFHQTIPEHAYLYGLPREYYLDYGVRRYGFHGTSHKFVSQRAAQLMGVKPEECKVIVCHLGNGASVSAVQYGKSVETSMGLTPLEGLIMGTRSGDLDPAIVDFIARKEHKSIGEVIEMLNKKSGILGISDQLSSDFRDLVGHRANGNKQAELALDAFAYRVAKYIGSYAAVMNGVDAIVFTAGAGENNLEVRSLIFPYLTYLGVEIDEQKNNSRGKEVILTTADSRTAVMVIPTNEELAIARETMSLVSSR